MGVLTGRGGTQKEMILAWGSETPLLLGSPVLNLSALETVLRSKIFRG
jgi:hypothetical protein